jgi:cytidylate kinase
MYRAATLQVLRSGVDPGDPDAVSAAVRSCEIRLLPKMNKSIVLLDGEEVSDEIRTPEVTLYASAISEIPQVRDILVETQRVMGAQGGVVLEGRDIGSVVFPDADLKIYLEADIQTRVVRRFRELREHGLETTVEDVTSETLERDSRDSSRAHSPLKRSEGAIAIDTTDLSIEEQVEKIVALAKEIIDKP